MDEKRVNGPPDKNKVASKEAGEEAKAKFDKPLGSSHNDEADLRDVARKAAKKIAVIKPGLYLYKYTAPFRAAFFVLKLDQPAFSAEDFILTDIIFHEATCGACDRLAAFVRPPDQFQSYVFRHIARPAFGASPTPSIAPDFDVTVHSPYRLTTSATPITRRTVPTPTPRSRAIRRIPLPAALACRMANSLSAVSRGRPSRVPYSRARAKPETMRSRSIARSNSANTPIIWNIARPPGVEVSRPCLCRNRSTPLECSSRRSSSRSVSERPSRSTDHAATMSISRRATAFIRASRPGRPSRLLAPDMPASSNIRATAQP